jgi:hypothetical protein
MTATAPTPVAAPGYRLTFARILRSEWIKLSTTKSALWTALAMALLMVLIGAMAAALSSGQIESEGVAGPPGFTGEDPFTTVMAGSTMVVLVSAVLGVLVGAREYSTSLIRTTLASVPRRWPVLVAKVLALVALVLPLLLVACFAAFSIGMSVLGADGGQALALSDDGVLRAVIGTAV